MKILSKSILLALSVSLLSACGSDNDDDDDDNAAREFEVTVTNLSHNQPMSPIAILLHDSGYSAWSIGSAASAGLEQLAEGGDNSVFIGGELSGQDAVAVSGSGPIPPGGSNTLSISATSANQLRVTLASMFVNTNDAFVGLGAVDLTDLAVGEMVKLNATVYDAGTEANSEAAGTIPGPADGGTGFDAIRDDIGDRVSRHAGVVSADDGLSSSVLSESHRFDNPGASISITRL